MKVQLVNDAFCYRAGMAIDADGSPHAYAGVGQQAFRRALGLPDIQPLDYLANAGSPAKWWGIVTNERGVPIVQGPNDPAPGFYISPTSLVNRAYLAKDPRRYVDSEKVPYGALESAAIVGDVGPKPGEGSIALAQALAIPSNPRAGGVDQEVVSYIAFKNSSRGWPREQVEIDIRARELFMAWGGRERLATVLAVVPLS